jgi:hypothetical protein
MWASYRAARPDWLSALVKLVHLIVSGRTARAALPVAALVGTVLSVVNQGATIWSGTWDGWTWVRVAANFATPYVVASVGYAKASQLGPRSP